MKLLNVKSVSAKQVEEHWGLKLPTMYFCRELFIRCNSKGNINWEVAPIYTKEELEKRGDYQILIVLNMDEFISSNE